MSLGPGWRRAFRLPFRTPRVVERDVDDEIAFHLAMRAEKLRRLGASTEQAEGEALARFGDRSRVRDECIDIDTRYAREESLMDWLHSLGADLRYALRTLRNRPAFTVVAALTLALGIGATTAIFSLVDGILLRPLPYAHPERIVRVSMSYPEKGLDHWVLSQENVAMFRDRTPDFATFAGYNRRTLTLTRDGQPESVVATLASGEFFDVLGVPPMLGRVFGPADDTPNASSVAVLGYGFWRTEFGADRNVIGRTIDVDGQPRRIIGVMPSGFGYPRPDAQVYVPVGLDPTHRFGWFLTGIARLRDGATVASAERSTTALMLDWARREPELLNLTVDPTRTRMRTEVVSLRTAITGDVERPLIILQVAVVAILLIAIANVATLMSSRASARGREIAVRTALGASRGRVVRQLLTESVALALLGGLLGVVFAYASVRAFTHSRAVTLPRIGEVGVNWQVLIVALTASIAAGLLFGVAPAAHTLRQRLADGLAGGKESARASARRINSALVVAQLALSVVLLISAGLVLKSFRRLVTVDLGFDPVGVTSIFMPLPHEKYTDLNRVPPTIEDIVSRVGAVPGVVSVAAASSLPYMSGTNTDGFLVEGRTPPANAGAETQTIEDVITPGFFRTLAIPIRFGRDFNAADRDKSVPVAILDEALADRYWNGAEALGKRIRFTGDTTWLTIVGVVGSVRDEDASIAPLPHTYTAMSQSPILRPSLAVRIEGSRAAAIPSIRQAIASIEPGAPLDIRPLSDGVSQSLDSRRLTEMLLGGFALLAVVLASVGIYGVMSLYVAHRQREFGIRLAIGAAPSRVRRAVLGEGMTLAICGVVIGSVVAAAATRWLRSILFEVSPSDPLVFASLAVFLLIVAFISCYAPARRAARSDPLLALRAE